MLPSLYIEKFRCFQSLTIDRLARVNLFVGLNNTGKTSVLDAAELLLGAGDLQTFQRQAQRRGEILGVPPESDIRHLFHKHRLVDGSEFLIEGRRRGSPAIRCYLSMTPEGPDTNEELALHVDAYGIRRRPLSPLGGLPFQASLRVDSDVHFGVPKKRPLQFVAPGSIDTQALGVLLDEVVLKAAGEKRVIDALRIIEPGIEKIAFLQPGWSGQRSFFVKLSGPDDSLPLGSMGDGIRRLLALSIHLDRSAGGSLLVDEIDTGLHYSVMTRMWRLVVETARRLDLQVFATTHSLDCILAIAELCERSPELGEDILLHRIDRDAPLATTYGASDLRVAAQQQMEVRGHAAESE